MIQLFPYKSYTNNAAEIDLLLLMMCCCCSGSFSAGFRSSQHWTPAPHQLPPGLNKHVLLLLLLLLLTVHGIRIQVLHFVGFVKNQFPDKGENLNPSPHSQPPSLRNLLQEVELTLDPYVENQWRSEPKDGWIGTYRSWGDEEEEL